MRCHTCIIRVLALYYVQVIEIPTKLCFPLNDNRTDLRSNWDVTAVNDFGPRVERVRC
jgi:hypothetical protein